MRRFRCETFYATLARPVSCRQTASAMAEKKRESMSTVDVAWLRMDRPSNLMVICGVLLLHARITIARLRSPIASRFLRFRRFRQRPLRTGSGFQWRPDDRFDLADY